MSNIPLHIKEIRVSQSSMDGYGLDVFLNSGMQLKSKFHDEKKYQEALAAKGNLTKLKDIFRDWIDNVIKENPQFGYHYSECEYFEEYLGHIMENPDDRMYEDALELLRSCGIEKNLEFDGYFNQRFRESSDSIVNFDEDYFNDPDKTELYVYLSASVDEEIFDKLHYTFRALFAKDLTPELVADKIEYLTKVKGVRF